MEIHKKMFKNLYRMIIVLYFLEEKLIERPNINMGGVEYKYRAPLLGDNVIYSNQRWQTGG